MVNKDYHYYYVAARIGTKYAINVSVCLFVRLQISQTTCPHFRNFLYIHVCLLWP